MFSYSTGGWRAAAESYGAKCVRRISKPFMRKLFRAHTLYKSLLVDLPDWFIWDKYFLKEINLNLDEPVYFVFYEGFRLAYSRHFLRHLKRKYPNSHFVYIFVNPIENNPNGDKITAYWNMMKKFYDAGITLSLTDAKKHDLLFNDYWPCSLPDTDFQPENSSDIFFVGQAKDRLPKILSVYEKLSSMGLNCDFHVTGVPESEQKYSDAIHYNHSIPYGEVLQRVKNTKCVLEVLPFGHDYSSLRVNEALWYHKKLLTTNMNAEHEWFYNPDIVFTFKNADEIDPDFILRPLAPEVFANMKVGDFNRFADFIIRSVNSQYKS